MAVVNLYPSESTNCITVLLWVVWVGAAGDTVAGRAYYFPAGCVYDNCSWSR